MTTPATNLGVLNEARRAHVGFLRAAWCELNKAGRTSATVAERDTVQALRDAVRDLIVERDQ